MSLKFNLKSIVSNLNWSLLMADFSNQVLAEAMRNARSPIVDSRVIYM